MFSASRIRVLGLPRRAKQALLITFDFIALSVTMWASFCLRYDDWYVPAHLDQWLVIVSASIVATPVFIRLGLYRAIVRYLPERAMWTIIKAMLVATVAWVVIVFLSQLAGRIIVPRSVPIIYFGLGTFVIAGSRFAAKWVFVPKLDRQLVTHKPLLIYGAGDAGVHLAQSLRSKYRIVGFLDDNNSLHRREIAGIRIYPPERLHELVHEYDVHDLILSVQSLPAQRRKEIIAAASKNGVKIRALPSIADLVTGKYLISQIQEIDTLELLGRSSVPPDAELIRKMITGRTIMVTGAGGSIGSELCRKIARWKPERLMLFEANEYALYQIEMEIAGIADLWVTPVLGSVTDRELVRRTLSANHVHVVFHAAAHKHVPLVEANALEGIKNNVFGTATVVEEAQAAGVEHFVLISSDKAVRPTNVMGATKRWSELLLDAAAKEAAKENSPQIFSAVRFGNVLGSNGSVVPLFRKQIAQGGPITLTDVAMTRYFMSIQEAAELIIQAGALAHGGDIFLLDMGKPMPIIELAENMIKLSGLTVRSEDNPEGDIEIVVTGRRPGEKLYEELLYDSATAQQTSHPKIMRTGSSDGIVDIQQAMDELKDAMVANDEYKARSILFDVVDKSG